MSDTRSLLTIAITNPDAQADEYETRAIIFRADGVTNETTLKVTVTNISEASMQLQQGVKIKLDFANIPLAADAVQKIKLSQPVRDWSIAAARTVLELTYGGGGFQWDHGVPLEFTLDGIIGEFDDDKVGTLTIEFDKIPALGNGMGAWKHPALLIRAPKVDLPSTVQTGTETKVLYTTDGFKNRLDFYLENKGDHITQASIEVSLACGKGPTDLIEPHDAPPVLTVRNARSSTLPDDIYEPNKCGDKLTWKVGNQDNQLLTDSRLEFSFKDIVTSTPGETIVTIELRNMNAYRNHTFILPIEKKETPQREIDLFVGWIAHVSGKPVLTLKWAVEWAGHCTLEAATPLCTVEKLAERYDVKSPPDGLDIALRELQTQYTLTAYDCEQEGLSVSKTVDVAVLPPEIRMLQISDADHVRGIVKVDWSTMNATTVHLKLEESVVHIIGDGIVHHFDGDVGLSESKWLSVGVWVFRTLTATLTAHGPFQKTAERTISWTG